MHDPIPRATLETIISMHVPPDKLALARQALAALRDPPSEPPGAGWTAPDAKARRRRG